MAEYDLSDDDDLRLAPRPNLYGRYRDYLSALPYADAETPQSATPSSTRATAQRRVDEQPYLNYALGADADFESRLAQLQDQAERVYPDYGFASAQKDLANSPVSAELDPSGRYVDPRYPGAQDFNSQLEDFYVRNGYPSSGFKAREYPDGVEPPSTQPALKFGPYDIPLGPSMRADVAGQTARIGRSVRDNLGWVLPGASGAADATEGVLDRDPLAAATGIAQTLAFSPAARAALKASAPALRYAAAPAAGTAVMTPSDADAGWAEPVPGAYISKLLTEAKKLNVNKATLDQWVNTLRNKGVKPEELDWVIQPDHLPTGAISREDFLKHIDRRQIQPQERTRTREDGEEVPDEDWEPDHHEVMQLSDRMRAEEAAHFREHTLPRGLNKAASDEINRTRPPEVRQQPDGSWSVTTGDGEQLGPRIDKLEGGQNYASGGLVRRAVGQVIERLPRASEAEAPQLAETGKSFTDLMREISDGMAETKQKFEETLPATPGAAPDRSEYSLLRYAAPKGDSDRMHSDFIKRKAPLVVAPAIAEPSLNALRMQLSDDEGE